MPTIDWTLNLGNLLTIASFVVGGVTFAVTIRKDVKQHSERFDALEREVAKIAEATITIARQDERMNGFEHRLTSLEEERKIDRLAKVQAAHI